MAFAHPERFFHIRLLLGVAEHLAWVLCSHDIEKFVLLTNLAKILVIGVDEVFEDGRLAIVLALFLDTCVFVLAVSSGFLSRLLLVSFQESISLLVIDLGLVTFVETLRDECKFELLVHLLRILTLSSFLPGSQPTCLLDIQ